MARSTTPAGTPITPDRANLNAGLAIVRTGTVQQVAFCAAAQSPKGSRAHAGFTVRELSLRLLAADAPLWARPVRVVDWTFMVNRVVGPRSRAGNVVHAFRHDTPKGTPTQCAGHGGDTCATTVPSVGDATRRWLADGEGTLPADVGTLARAALKARIADLTARKFSAGDIAATASIAAYAEALGAPAAPRKRAPKKAAIVVEPTEAAPAPVE